ncbi:MAG: HD domain-containing phosphohydrolase [Pseudomonadota bacterium]
MEQKTRLLKRLNELHGIVKAMSRETDHKKLLEMTVFGARLLTNADGGTLYFRDKNQLKFEIIFNESLKIHMGGSSHENLNFDPLPLYLDGSPNLNNVACYAVINDQIVNLEDAYLTQDFDFSRTRQFDKQTGYRSKSFLTIPLKNHEKEIIGVIQLINAQDEDGNICSFSQEDQMFTEFLATLAAITLTNYTLIQQQEGLFVVFADVIASAIDDKSPHTGKHCHRVPIITMMLAEAAAKANWGSFTNFTMNENDRKELHLAALLHDCGKITTPVHVIEKSTKLETIIDRIQLIDTRFEVLKRDLQITYLNKKLDLVQSNAQNDFTELESELSQKLNKLEDDRKFVREVNIGGEYLDDEKLDRIKQIGRMRWINEEGLEDNFLSFDETNCLSIRRGTLTSEEREIINRHIDVTVMMLEKLPYPKHLARIPEFAGGHHERMDGKGRPKGLKRDEMSLQARIMGCAEVFEALTAKDRPYKKGKTLSESLKIMGVMAEEQHIDQEVFTLLIDSGVFQDYANQYVDPSQFDEIDAKTLRGYLPVEARSKDGETEVAQLPKLVS